MGANVNFPTDLISSTLRRYEPKLRSSILDKDILLRLLKERAMDHVAGGRALAYPQIESSNSTFKSYQGAETLDLSIQEGFTNAEYQFAQYAGAVVITGIDQFKNSLSESQIFDLVKAKVKQLEDSVSAKLSLNAATSNSANSKDILGLSDLIDAGTNDTVGGINSSTQAFWRNQHQTIPANNFGVTMAGNGMTAMNSSMKNATKESRMPDLIVTTPSIHGMIENVLVSSQRFQSSESASWGFDRLPFKGADVIFEGNIATGNIYLINTDDLRLVMGQGANFRVEETPPPANQDIRVWRYIAYMALVAKARRTQARISGITTQS